MRRMLIRPWGVVTVLCLIYCMAVILANEGDPLALVTLGTQFSEADPTGTEGYDGQFGYYIARDPSTAAGFIDVPAYRFQRILLPGLGWALSLGNDALIPWVFLVVGLVSLAAGTAILENLLIQHGVSRWIALAYGLTIGTFGAVRLSLPEPLAYALALGGIWLITQNRWLWSAVLFALAALARETTLLIPVAYGLYLLSQHHWKVESNTFRNAKARPHPFRTSDQRKTPWGSSLLQIGQGKASEASRGEVIGQIAIPFGLITLAPFIIWQAILYTHLGSFGVGSGGAKATGFEIIPFAGIIRIITDVPAEARLSVLLIFSAMLVPFVLVPTVWALLRCWRDWRVGSVTVYTFLLFTHAAIMPFVPFSTYREPLGILRFIVGLQIAVILYAARHHNSRVLRYSTVWIVTTMFIFSLI